MTKMIFVNLPVANLERAKAFYESVGFTNNPQFTDETAACMVWSEAISIMLLTHAKWMTFTTRSIPGRDASGVMVALTLGSRQEVDRFVASGAANGGTADTSPPQDHGFMYQRTLLDPDGHVLEPFWMDPAVAQSAQPPAGAT